MIAITIALFALEGRSNAFDVSCLVSRWDSVELLCRASSRAAIVLDALLRQSGGARYRLRPGQGAVSYTHLGFGGV